jgi:arylsulfatase A-like enzyme
MNIIVIIADDLGFADVGFRGKDIHTPFMDSLAAEGTIFDQFYTQPVCTGTRVSIYTGDYAFKQGFNGVIWPWSDYGILKKDNLPNTFKRNNYDTYLIGKWHVGHSKKRYLPNQMGFNYHYGGHTGAMDHWSHTYHNVHDFQENGKPIYPKGHSTDLYADKVIEILKNRSKEKHFLMFLTFNAPHVPLQTHNSFIEKYKFKNHKRNIYAAMVTHMDNRIGDLLSVLKKEGHYEDTLIWFTSDNGGWLGEFGGNNFPLKDGKISFYEGGIRVVNFAKMPIKEKKFNQVCHAIDMFPTLCEFAKIECPKTDGFPITSIPSNRDLIHHFVKTNENNFVGCIRSEKYKYIKYQKEELYDIENDPCEKNNLINNEEEKNKLKNKLKNMEKFYKECYIGWTPPNGYPENFKFPKFWGPPIRNYQQLKSLNDKKLNLSMKESLGVY